MRTLLLILSVVLFSTRQLHDRPASLRLCVPRKIVLVSVNGDNFPHLHSVCRRTTLPPLVLTSLPRCRSHYPLLMPMMLTLLILL